MASFDYQGFDDAGNPASGSIDADSREEALNVLLGRGITPFDLDARSLGNGTGRTKPLTDRDAGEFCRELGSLVRARLPLDQCLENLSATGGSSVRRRARDLAAAVRSGAALSAAIEAQGECFPDEVIGMIRAGERSGALGETLILAADHLEQRANLRDTLTGSLTYPAILLAMMVVTLILIVTVVLPRLELMFAGAEGRLPPATAVLLAVGDFVSDWGDVIVLAISALLLAGLRYARTLAGRRRLHAWLAESRWTSSITVQAQYCQFARLLAALVRSGITVPDAVELAAPSIRNLEVQAQVTPIASAIRAAQSLDEALARLNGVPDVLVSLAAAGLRTGSLGESLEEAARLLEGRLRRRMDRLLALVVPGTTIAMGLLTAGIIGAVLTGILGANEVLQ